jgi:hypothetical protein
LQHYNGPSTHYFYYNLLLLKERFKSKLYRFNLKNKSKHYREAGRRCGIKDAHMADSGLDRASLAAGASTATTAAAADAAVCKYYYYCY